METFDCTLIFLVTQTVQISQKVCLRQIWSHGQDCLYLIFNFIKGLNTNSSFNFFRLAVQSFLDFTRRKMCVCLENLEFAAAEGSDRPKCYVVASSWISSLHRQQPRGQTAWRSSECNSTKICKKLAQYAWPVGQTAHIIIFIIFLMK